MELNKKDTNFLEALVESHKQGIRLLTGFRSLTKEEKSEENYYNSLIKKLNKLLK